MAESSEEPEAAEPLQPLVARRRLSNGCLFSLALIAIIPSILLSAFVSCENRAIARNDVVAKHQLQGLRELLEQYRTDVGCVPSDDVGLNALLTRPPELDDSSAWKGPYIACGFLPTDPWGRAYFYEAVDEREFRVGSSGTDGVPHTTDDITN